jgi:hypothetical protein
MKRLTTESVSTGAKRPEKTLRNALSSLLLTGGSVKGWLIFGKSSVAPAGMDSESMVKTPARQVSIRNDQGNNLQMISLQRRSGFGSGSRSPK